MSKNKKYGKCPRCNYIMVRKKIRKPTICNNCGFGIENPHEVFSSDKIILKGGKTNG